MARSTPAGRWRARGAIAAVALAATAGCWAASPPAPTVRVGIIGSLDELPVYVMLEQGIASKHRLDLQTSEYGGGARIIGALAAGALDLSWSVGSVPLLAAAQRGTVPDQVIALATNATVDPEHPGIGVVVAPAIRRWADLSGALVGVYALESLGSAAVRARLAREGVTDYRLVEIALPNLGLALAGADVAAIAVPEPFVTQSVLRGDGVLLDWIIGGSPFPHMLYTVVAARAGWPRERPDAVKRALAAHLDAVSWIAANPDSARSLVARRLGITDELARRMHLVHWPADGRADDRLFASMQPVLAQMGLLGAPIPAERVFDRRVLDELLRERRR